MFVFLLGYLGLVVLAGLGWYCFAAEDFFPDANIGIGKEVLRRAAT